MRGRSRSGLLTGVAAAAFLLVQPMTAIGADTAAARPLFELPFPCGEEWQGATYHNHGGDNDWPLDFNQGAGDDDLGMPVVASAAGDVSIRTEGDGDHVTVVNHGGGWTTEYRHMSARTVTSGHVESGDQVGAVGRESHGNSISPHLHYEQKLNGNAQPIYLHGSAAPYSYVYNGPTFVSHNCGGASMTGVTTISRGVGLLDVFAIGSDGVLRHRAWVRDHWSPTTGDGWVRLTGGMTTKLIGDPAAVSSRPGRIDVFARGTDNHLKRLAWDADQGGWGVWHNVDGWITASPAATSRSDTGVDVFARNSLGWVIWRHFNTVTNTFDNGWGGLYDKVTSSGPAAVSSPDGTRMNVFARDTDGSLLSLMWTQDHGWWNWADRGGSFTGRPTASTRGGYGVDIFMRASNDSSLLHRNSPDGANWNTATADLGGVIFTSPASVSQNADRIDVFTRNNAGTLIQRIWSRNNPPSGWYPWVGVAPIP